VTSASTARAKNGVRKRYVSEPALVCLKLEAKGLGELPLSFRKRIFDLVLTHPEMTTVRPVEAVQIDVEQARREVHESIDELRQAEQMVTADAGYPSERWRTCLPRGQRQRKLLKVTPR
jgi:hypothetical protein